MTPDISYFQFSEHVERILKTEVNVATHAHDFAKAEFRLICSAPNGGEPQEVHEATRKQILATEAFAVALQRFSDFIINETIPEDLQNPRAPGIDALSASRIKATGSLTVGAEPYGNSRAQTIKYSFGLLHVADSPISPFAVKGMWSRTWYWSSVRTNE